eukprot:CAMPEP_0176395006 /NCGR_PEP_ID=MMETSP0126-20121128/43054_1 /TAXON_ID=141414 ORGANISM="Strombidinopsis acuminatum, Strain SPMC142" /NCGR_SAMPLE_ID=MMETSP0126 /ASSEMBLY_ACC=CAM_ASM_000229 /LENGTH=75 /DNA_ID=CAMNT_0017767607 /DNA_START=688 /DNA_END=915 /DNA_ORIENTATION=+
MLKKDPEQRASIDDLLTHKWVTKNGAEDVILYDNEDAEHAEGFDDFESFKNNDSDDEDRESNVKQVAEALRKIHT